MMSSGKSEILLQFFFNELSQSQVYSEYSRSMRSFLWKIQNGFWELKENLKKKKNIWKK